MDSQCSSLGLVKSDTALRWISWVYFLKYLLGQICLRLFFRSIDFN